MLHLPGREGQDLERRVVDPVLVEQHLLDRADDRFVVGGLLPDLRWAESSFCSAPAVHDCGYGCGYVPR